uniref:alpha/beta fold hydrolase n=1 Tax=Stenotrophomonas indicatrix TaxID=2045451 RepID=UPI003CD019DE
VAMLARLLLGRWRTGEHMSMLRAALAQVPATTLRQRAAATLRVDVRALLPQIGVPTLCLQAGHDRLLWPPSVADLQTLLPDARHVALDGPHLLLQACAEPAAAVVAGWVRALPATG